VDDRASRHNWWFPPNRSDGPILRVLLDAFSTFACEIDFRNTSSLKALAHQQGSSRAFAMSVSLLKARLSAGFLLCAALSGVGHAQEPSPSLKEADADYRAGVAALSRHDLNAALSDFQKVVRLAPTAEQGHSALGAVLVQLGRTGEGIRELEKALSMMPGDSTAQLNLALAYERSGETSKALPWFGKLEATSRADKRPLPPYVLASYARALAATKQYPAAVAKMKDAVAGDPQNAELHDELGSLYAQREDWSHAREAFTAAIQANPDLAMAHLHLAMTLDAEHQPAGSEASTALDELAKAYQLAPQNSVIALQYGQSLAATDMDEHAIRYFSTRWSLIRVQRRPLTNWAWRCNEQTN